MQMMLLLVGAAELAEERHVDLAEHIEDSQARRRSRAAPRSPDGHCIGRQMISSLDMKPANGGTPADRQRRDQEGP